MAGLPASGFVAPTFPHVSRFRFGLSATRSACSGLHWGGVSPVTAARPRWIRLRGLLHGRDTLADRQPHHASLFSPVTG